MVFLPVDVSAWAEMVDRSRIGATDLRCGFGRYMRVHYSVWPILKRGKGRGELRWARWCGLNICLWQMVILLHVSSHLEIFERDLRQSLDVSYSALLVIYINSLFVAACFPRWL